MSTFHIHASETPGSFHAKGILPRGIPFSIDGMWHQLDNGSVQYRLTFTLYNSAFGSGSLEAGKEFYVGSLSDEGDTLSGVWARSEADVKHPFLFKRVSPDILVSRPSPEAFRENKTRALWNYAITAALNEARRKLFSWSYIKERRDRRIEYLRMLDGENNNTSKDRDSELWSRLYRLSTYQESQSFFALNNDIRVYT